MSRNIRDMVRDITTWSVVKLKHTNCQRCGQWQTITDWTTCVFCQEELDEHPDNAIKESVDQGEEKDA